MSGQFVEERQEVLDAVQRIVAVGLVSGASGNVSRRIVTPGGDLFAVTASTCLITLLRLRLRSNPIRDSRLIRGRLLTVT